MYSPSFQRRLYALQQIVSSLIFAVATFPQPIPLVFANSGESAFASAISTKNTTVQTPIVSASIPTSSYMQTAPSNHHPATLAKNYSTPAPITSAPNLAQPTIDSPTATSSTSTASSPKTVETTTIPVSNSTSKNLKKSQKTTPAITIAGRTLSIFKSTHTLTDSDDRVARYGDKFLYGHNTSDVFGGLKHLRVGSHFTITENGKTTTYQIRHLETMTKSDTANFMWAIVHADFRGRTYDLSLMTCAGTPRPNRDATHRLILFADRI